MMRAIALLIIGASLMIHQPVIADNTTDSLSTQRKSELTHMVLQDCGSCHGMRLTGGLGPSITPKDLRTLNTQALASIISHGIPGTAMPPWNLILEEFEIHWIAQQLIAGGFAK